MFDSIRPETGALVGEYPYVKAGDGPETLVVIPGIDDALFSGEYGRLGGAAIAYGFRRFLEDYTVYVVSRPRGLPEGSAIADMAADYVTLLEENLGPASVFGLSMGGLIAQEVAISRPELVDRLVLGVAGSRLDPQSTQLSRRLRWYALEHEWTKIRTELSRELYTGWRRRLYPRLSNALGRVRPPTPAVPEDVVISIDAVTDFDSRDRLDQIEPRTIVIGADEDPFFPEPILRETHAGIPDAQLAMFREVKHGVFIERKAAFDNWVLEFLRGETPRMRHY